jgi:hypothetical protein
VAPSTSVNTVAIRMRAVTACLMGQRFIWLR